MNPQFHIPVLRKEVAEYLITNPDGIYVDGTVGGGGHAEFLLSKLNINATYIAIDQDIRAIEYAKQRLSHKQNIHFYHSNFNQLVTIFQQLKINRIDGLLLDLGISSFQIDQINRGFSYLNIDSPLDMRMDQSSGLTASDLINDLDADSLFTIFKKYGEEKKAKQIANLVVKFRQHAPVKTAKQLRDIIDKVTSPKFRIKSYARIFQALRIAINNELENLKIILTSGSKFLTSGGRIVVISYHSLEDRTVKNFLKEKANPCICPPDFPQCSCGRMQELKIITPKVIKPGPDEIKKNPRSRSAVMRVGERV
jgi:16S rRNA (cytosine1402-N4)-methyltransferase